MGASVVIPVALGALVLGDLAKIEFLLGMVGALLLLVGSIARYLYSLSFGVTRSTRVGTLVERMHAIQDLGTVRRTFTNYTPWRFRFGLLLVVGGVACGVVGHFAGIGGGRVLAFCGLLFGIPTLLYTALLRVDHLDLHERGLVFRQGKKATVVYYSEITKVFINYFHYKSDYESVRVPTSLVIQLHDGGTIQIGKTFLHLPKAFIELSSLCSTSYEIVLISYDSTQVFPFLPQGSRASDLNNLLSGVSTDNPASSRANAAGGIEEKGERTRHTAGSAGEPRWRVVGTEEPSGKEIVREIPAPSAEEAMAVAVLDGINVTAVERIG